MNTIDKSRPSNDWPYRSSTSHLLIDDEGQLVASDGAALAIEDDDLARIEIAEEYLRRSGKPVNDEEIIELVLEGKRSALPTRTARRRFDAEREVNARRIALLLSARAHAGAAREQAIRDDCAMSTGYLIEFTLEEARAAIPTLAARLRFDRNRATQATTLRLTAGCNGEPVAAMANGSDVALRPEDIPWPPCSLPCIDNESLGVLARDQALREGAELNGAYILEFTLELLRGSIARLPDRLNFDRHRAAARVGEVRS